MNLDEALSTFVFSFNLCRYATTAACLHRFCGTCIEEHLRKGHHDCPTCRGHIPTRRSLRADPAFDAIVSALYEHAADYDMQVGSDTRRIPDCLT